MVNTSATSESKREELRSWQRFFRSESFALSEDASLLQQQIANKHPNEDVARAAKARLKSTGQTWIELLNRGQSSALSPLLGVLKGHAGPVLDVAIAGQHKFVVSASEDGTLRVWSAHTTEESMIIRAHKGGARTVVVTGDGKFLLSAGSDRAIKMWHAGDWSLTNEWTAEQPVIAMGAANQSACYVCGTNLVGVIDLDSSQVRIMNRESWVSFTAVCMTDTDSPVIVGTSDGLIAMLDLTDGQPLRVMRGHTDVVTSLALSPDHALLASASKDRSIILWDMSSGRMLLRLEGHTDIISDLLFSTDGSTIISSSYDETIRSWSITDARPLRVLRGHGDRIHCLALDQGTGELLSGGWDRNIVLWDLEQVIMDEKPEDQLCHSALISSTAVSPAAKTAVSASWDNSLIIWNTNERHAVKRIAAHKDKVTSVDISTDGQKIASGSRDGTAKIFDARAGTCVRTYEFDSYHGWVNAVAFTRHDQGLTYGTERGLVAICSLQSRKIGQILNCDMSGVRAIDEFPSEDRVAAGGFGESAIGPGGIKEPDGLLQTLQVGAEAKSASDSEQEKVLGGHEGTVSSVVVSPDGGWTATTAWDGWIIKRRAISGEIIEKWRVDLAPLYVLALSPDGRWLFSGGRSKGLKLWDVTSAQLKGQFFCEGEVRACSIWIEQQRLLGMVGDSTGRIYFLAIPGLDLGPEILTARRNPGAIFFECRHCLQINPLSEDQLGTEVSCSRANCEAQFRLNTFTVFDGMGADQKKTGPALWRRLLR